jgi:hypothetical protein
MLFSTESLLICGPWNQCSICLDLLRFDCGFKRCSVFSHISSSSKYWSVPKVHLCHVLSSPFGTRIKISILWVIFAILSYSVLILSFFVILLKIVTESSYALRSFSPRFREIVTYPKAIVKARRGTGSKVLLTSPTGTSRLCYTGPSWCHCGFIYRLKNGSFMKLAWFFCLFFCFPLNV